MRQIISGTGSPKSSRPASRQATRRSSSSPLSRTLTVKPRRKAVEEGVCGSHERGALQRVVGAEGAVGDDGDPGPARTHDGPAALQQRTPATPMSERTVEGNQRALTELFL